MQYNADVIQLLKLRFMNECMNFLETRFWGHCDQICYLVQTEHHCCGANTVAWHEHLRSQSRKQMTAKHWGEAWMSNKAEPQPLHSVSSRYCVSVIFAALRGCETLGCHCAPTGDRSSELNNLAAFVMRPGMPPAPASRAAVVRTGDHTVYLQSPAIKCLLLIRIR